RDFFYRQHNYIAELDEAAEAIGGGLGLPVGAMTPGLMSYLESRHGVNVLIDAIDEVGTLRLFDGRTRTLRLSPGLHPGQHGLQLATHNALLELRHAIRAIP